MKHLKWFGAATLALGASLAMAQSAPESLLPPGFDDPAPAPSPRPAPAPRPSAAPAPSASGAPTATATSRPVIQQVPGSSSAAAPSAPAVSASEFDKLPSLRELEAMSTDELDELLGLKPKFDIPPAARRSMARVGVITTAEGGLPSGSLAKQPASLVRAALSGTKGPLVSRWGHIMLRRALASRLAAPAGMNPAEFAALRIGLLNRMGEHVAARAIAQDVDTNNWNKALTNAAIEAYLGTSDIVGACPAVRYQGDSRDDPQWVMLQSICRAFAGEGAAAGTQLDRAMRRGIAPRIDVLLAQRFAGAAGRGRRAVNVEWDGVEELNPWRYALANAVGQEIPAALLQDAGPYYQRIAAVSPMLPLPARVTGADRAAGEGIMSANAMVDLYSQIYAEDGIEGDPALTASRLRDAYVAPEVGARWQAIQDVWGGTSPGDYGRSVLTAYAAARLPASSSLADNAEPLIASMLTAGLDKDAMAWGAVVEEGSAGWGLLALAQPNRSGAVRSGAIDTYVDADGSAGQTKSKFLIAGLSGLGRLDQQTVGDFSDRLGMNLGRETRWTKLIDRAAAVDNKGLVALLAGLGMQGTGWDKMTPVYLYHIVSALDRVGMRAEARMIAAEAVARA